MTDSAARGRRIALSTGLIFAMTAIPLASLGSATGIYLPRHLAANVGISLAAVGATFGLVRLLDIFVDLVLGVMMDRTRTPLGRYRAWMLVGVPVILPAVYVLFVRTPTTTDVLIPWLLLLALGGSILTLASGAWAATLVADYDGRSRLFGAIGALSVLGSLTVFLVPVLLALLGRADAEGVTLMGWFIVVALPVTVGLAVALVPERVRPNLSSEPLRMRDYMAVVLRPTFARILVADFCFAMGPGWLSSTFLFFCVDARGLTISEASVLLVIGISSGLVGAHVLSRLAVRWSKHHAIMLNAAGYAIALGGLAIGPKGSLPHAAAAMVVLGFFTVAFQVLLRAMTADAADELRLEQGRERSGLLFAMVTLTSKAATALSIFFTFTLLPQVGYDPAKGAENSESALLGLTLVSLAGPAAFVLLGAACFLGYRLTAERHNEIRRDLELRESELAAPPPA